MRRTWLPALAMAALVVPAWPVTATVADPELGAEVTATQGGPVPLRAAKPAWLTPELEATVLAADGVPVQAPPDAPLPSEIGIRPGSWMIEPAGCTMNFVFAKQGRLGIGTAGHCVDRGDEVVLLTLALGGDPVLVNIGRVVIDSTRGDDSSRDDKAVGHDFALVEIDPALHEWVFPSMALLGGPCGIYGGSGPDAVFHVGHGLVVGTGGTPRTGLGLYYEPDAVYWAGVAAPGDSGSPVRASDSSAVSNLTHLIVDREHAGATVVGTSITKILELAGGWSLVDGFPCSGTTDGGGGNGRGKGRDEERD